VEMLTGKVCAFVTKLDDLLWILIFLIKLLKFEKPLIPKNRKKGKSSKTGGWLNRKHLEADEYVALRLTSITESWREPKQGPATNGGQPVPNLPRWIWNTGSPPLSSHLLWGLCCHLVWQRADVSSLQGKSRGWPIMERRCNNIFYPALLILLSNNPGELQCNVSSVNIQTHNHWEFVNKTITEIE
jgi:hypothetical protein